MVYYRDDLINICSASTRASATASATASVEFTPMMPIRKDFPAVGPRPGNIMMLCLEILKR